MKFLNSLIALMILLAISSCEDDGAVDQDVAPSVTIVKPATSVNSGEQIPITLQFADDKGLSHVEISLGSNENSGAIYHYLQRGLSGREDNITYMVDPPTNMDIRGSNYILITCRDNGGNSTVLDEDFSIVDGTAPTGDFVYNDISLRADTSGRAEVVYNAADNDGLKRVTLEMWEVDAQNDKVQLMDQVIHDPAGAPTYQKQYFFKGKTSYTAGNSFRFYIRIVDEADNVTEVASDDIGTVTN